MPSRKVFIYESKKNNYLIHWGIKGQKWGIRRYQNFDGSYTQAGLARYFKSKNKYESAKSNYQSVKQDSNSSRYSKQYAKSKVKEAKQQMNKDYKHLKQDKLADKGKVRYSNGERIRSKAATDRAITGIATITLGVLASNSEPTYENTATKIIRNGIVLGNAIAIGGLSVKKAIDSIGDRELRAYYAHSSNY